MKLFNKMLRREEPQKLSSRPIIVVSGLPRSGTSMMMKILDAGGFPIVTDNLREADEDNPKGYYELEEVKALGNGEPEWIKDASGKVVKIISFLLQYLPNAYPYKILFMRRSVDEILASQRKMLERRGEVSRESDEKVAETFNEHLKRVKVWLSNQKNIEVLYIDHRALLEDPSTVVDQVVDFLDVDLPTEVRSKMAEVPDQKLYRNRSV